ncbi:nucleoside-diphosphate-sugar epimerase [Rhizobium sp. BK650]|uniref:NAD-dependent epimerase/dehydratase family protein n=1 Tax=Rhizobium sp. BK650 TaxID=2586990 RepID=UPI00160A5B3B|nr:NAD-dependent epimerase/dehydratase family protein [Rhizobium sp. BK650]MBB3659907.1 nucleoside-diphosphate-sugar epimerase [Rhizobium sp. BK650]
MSFYVIVGAGPVGRATARRLAAEGHKVSLVSRRGTAAQSIGVEPVALDAADADGLARASTGAEAIFMCAMADYTRWPTDFPPIMNGVVAAAESVNARLLLAGNVYGYGDGAQSPLTESATLAPTTVKGRIRTAMWDQALAASVPALEIRASDYLGAGAGSLFTLMVLPSLLNGQAVAVVGDLDAPHAWSFTEDVARTLVAASRYTGPWNRAFHVPSRHVSLRGLSTRFLGLAGRAPVELRVLGDAELMEMAERDDLIREVAEMAYLSRRPLLLDATETEKLLGVDASGLDTMITDTLHSQGVSISRSES